MRKIHVVAVGALAALAVAPAAYAQQQQQQRGPATQELRYACSVMVPTGTADSRLAQLARVSSRTAAFAAIASVPGTVNSVQLEEENGCLGYSVEIKGSDGTYRDVKVDAGTGKVVHAEVGSARPGTEEENVNEGSGEGESTED